MAADSSDGMTRVAEGSVQSLTNALRSVAWTVHKRGLGI